MAKPEWGVKRLCPSCGTRYYDMRKEPPVCPTCATPYDPEALLKSRRARPAPVDDTKKAPTVVARDDLENEVEVGEGVGEIEAEDGAAVEDIETDADEAHEDDVLIEDTSELGEDDMDEVVDVDEDNEEEH